MFKIKNTFQDNISTCTWREFGNLTYGFLERNKAKLMKMYNIEKRYNPTEMKKEFIKWSKKNNLPPVVENIHQRPYYISQFFTARQLSQNGFNF